MAPPQTFSPRTSRSRPQSACYHGSAVPAAYAGFQTTTTTKNKPASSSTTILAQSTAANIMDEHAHRKSFKTCTYAAFGTQQSQLWLAVLALAVVLTTGSSTADEADGGFLSHANVYVRIEPAIYPATDRFDLYQPAGTLPTTFLNRFARSRMSLNPHKRTPPASFPLLLPPEVAQTNPLTAVLAEAEGNNITTTTTTSVPTTTNNQKIKLNHVLRLLDTIPPPQLTIQAGERLMLECGAAGTPAPEIHWLRNGQPYKPTSVKNITDDIKVTLRSSGQFAVEALGISSTNGRLLIPCVDAADAGVYTCVAETPYLRKSTETEVTITGRVKCHTAPPAPAATASSSAKNSNPVARAQRSVLLNRGRVNSASNRYNDDSSISDLFRRIVSRRAAVTQPQNPLVRVQSATQPAHMYMWTSNVMELNGNDVRLMCRAAGSPAPSISWRTPTGIRVELSEQQSPASAQRKYEILKSGDLIVRRLEFNQDMGTFACTAKNSVGSEKVEMFVYPTTLD